MPHLVCPVHHCNRERPFRVCRCVHHHDRSGVRPTFRFHPLVNPLEPIHLGIFRVDFFVGGLHFELVHVSSFQVGDCPFHHLDAVVELAHAVVAVVADPTPKRVVVVVVVEYHLAGLFTDRTRCRFRLRVFPVQPCPNFALVRAARLARMLAENPAWQRVVDRE